MTSKHTPPETVPHSEIANPASRKLKHQLTKSQSLDSQDDGGTVQTLGEDNGLGRVLLGIRYHSSNSSLEVRIVRGESLRCFDGKQPASTYCSVTFLPDRTEPVVTATVEAIGGCPRWRAAFVFEKFPKLLSSTTRSNQRCLLVQVHNPASGGLAISEATLLLGNWTQEDVERGIRIWKYLNGTQETQRTSNKQGNASLTLFCRSDRFKVTLHRIEDLSPRYTAASETPDFQIKIQASLIGRGVIKEASFRGIRATPGGDVNFYDAEFSVRLGKQHHNGSGIQGAPFTVRIMLVKPTAGQEQQQQQQICWLELGSDVKRMDCRSLYQSVIENPNQAHIVTVRMNRSPFPPPLDSPVPQQQQQQQQQQHKSQSHHKSEA